jgi:hypothetical protein
MELKSYEKPWLPAFKGIILIIFGLVGILQIVGSLRMLSILLIILTGMIAVLLTSVGILFKTAKFRPWIIISGFIHLGFMLALVFNLNSLRHEILWIFFAWVIYYAITETVEAVILISLKNAFAALFFLNAMLTLLFGYFVSLVIKNFTAQGVFYIGLIAFVFGVTNILSAYLLGRIKE